MAAITEDYVSFEVAKILKEKGFEGECYWYYTLEADDNVDEKTIVEPSFEELSYNKENYLKAPTLQMACKWLRLEHNLYINVYPDANGEDLFYPNIYILNNDDWETLFCKDLELKYFNKPEQATEAAIKYCLKKLI